MHWEPPPAFDYYLPLMSLPQIFQTTLDTIPGPSPYLPVPPGEDLPPVPPGHRKIGLVWSCNRLSGDNDRRSLRLEELAPVLEVPGAVFFSLQKPVPPADQAAFRACPNLVDIEARLGTFRDTAAAIGQMDLVLTVDTAVAHLAGALGKPTWTLLHWCPNWRWLRARTDTPWYPTMRLFRQVEAGRWQGPVAAVAAEMRRVCG
jgi:hypothetical protein